jgi:hypothetical protein
VCVHSYANHTTQAMYELLLRNRKRGTAGQL